MSLEFKCNQTARKLGGRRFERQQMTRLTVRLDHILNYFRMKYFGGFLWFSTAPFVCVTGFYKEIMADGREGVGTALADAAY